jgi:drug/metabolite transporter (DMT)-like permease
MTKRYMLTFSFIYNSAIFASIFLKEKLGSIGKIGCLLSVVGAFIVVLHAPEDRDVTSIDELLYYALQPGK